MPVMKLATIVRTAVAQTLIDVFDDGTGPCLLEFYDGAQPAGPGTAVTTQVKLGTLECDDPIGTAATGALVFGTITQDAAADASGTVTWARLVDGDGTALADFDVSNNAGTGVIKMNTTTIVMGGPIAVTSFVIVVGGV